MQSILGLKEKGEQNKPASGWRGFQWVDKMKKEITKASELLEEGFR